jgi:poly-gamma-glutamate synthesis protein (capsule biosynthesis protein)
MRRGIWIFCIASALLVSALAGAWQGMRTLGLASVADIFAGRTAPVPLAEQPSPQPRNATTTIAAVGDIMLSRSVGSQMARRKDFSYPFSGALDFLRQGDIVFGNLEGPMSERGANQGSIYSFRADPRAVTGLKDAGFSVLSLANNHMLDWGRTALEDTVSILRDNGIETVGAGSDFASANQPAIIERNGIKVAFLAYTNLLPRSLQAGERPGISSFDLDMARNEIASLKSSGKADTVIVSFHWGEEYQQRANAFQIRTAHALIDAGADIILGHHPHVAQQAEAYKDKLIFYSLGNFIFDQNFSTETMRGRTALITLVNGAPVSARLYANIIDKTYRVASVKEDAILYSNSTTTIP